MAAVRVHLGCGNRHLPGWVHVDVRRFPHVDHIADVGDLHMFGDGSVDEIYACHVLEHIERRKLLPTIIEWNRVLKKDGVLRIAVPDFDAAHQHYQQTGRLWEIMGLLVGGQRDEWDHHCFAFDMRLMRELLTTCGFANVIRYNWETFLPEGFDDYSRCYLPHMDTSTGRLMSLNVTAKKCGPPSSPSRELAVAIGLQLNR